MAETISTLIVITIVTFIFLRYGRIRTVTHINYIARKRKNNFRVKYKKFDGIEYYHFRLRKQENITIKYNVTVEKGSLTIEWRDRKNTFFQKTFSESSEGEFHYKTELKLHTLKLEAEHTKGGCQLELARA